MDDQPPCECGLPATYGAECSACYEDRVRRETRDQFRYGDGVRFRASLHEVMPKVKNPPKRDYLR